MPHKGENKQKRHRAVSRGTGDRFLLIGSTGSARVGNDCCGMGMVHGMQSDLTRYGFETRFIEEPYACSHAAYRRIVGETV